MFASSDHGYCFFQKWVEYFHIFSEMRSLELPMLFTIGEFMQWQNYIFFFPIFFPKIPNILLIIWVAIDHWPNVFMDKLSKLQSFQLRLLLVPHEVLFKTCKAVLFRGIS